MQKYSSAKKIKTNFKAMITNMTVPTKGREMLLENTFTEKLHIWKKKYDTKTFVLYNKHVTHNLHRKFKPRNSGWIFYTAGQLLLNADNLCVGHPVARWQRD
jgi:hypothetical protein